MKKIKSNKKIIRKQEKGIALVTTIILTSIMLSSVVLITKEMVDEVKNSTRLDNSLIAYYAAEAGLEDALLEFRYDHSTEICKEAGINVACKDDFPRTVNLDTNQPDYGAKNYNTSYYDLIMWNKVKSILNQKILRDDVAEFVVPNLTENVILDWSKNPNTPLNSGYRVEITVYDEDGTIIPPEGISDSQGRTGGKMFTLPEDTSFIIRTSVGGGKKIIRIKPAYVNLTPDTNGAYTEGDPILNDTPYILLNINRNPTADFIAGLTTKIESIGYYGGVQRKIIATVDRPSGNILNIFDYVIYSGGDLIK